MMAKLSTLLAAFCFAAGLVRGDQCNADNCARAVESAFRASHAVTDCKSFQICTVTPATYTTTETITVTPSLEFSTVVATTVAITSTVRIITEPASTVYVSSASPVFKRAPAALEHWLNPPQYVLQAALTSASAVTNCPTSVPTYASACSGGLGAAASSYGSACSCLSVTKTTTTLPTPTTCIQSTTTAPTPISTIPATATTLIDVVGTVTTGIYSELTYYPTCTATATEAAVGPSYCECQYSESCGKYTADTCNWPKKEGTYADCFQQCDFYVDCIGFNFDYKSGACTLCDRNATSTGLTKDGVNANAVRRNVTCGGEGGYQCYTE